MHIQRTGDDTSGKTWERTRVMGVNTLAFCLPQHGVFYEIDADCVGIMGADPLGVEPSVGRSGSQVRDTSFRICKPGLLGEKEKGELHKIMLEASVQKRASGTCRLGIHRLSGSMEDEEGQVEYNWYEETGTTVQGNNDQKYYVYNPLS